MSLIDSTPIPMSDVTLRTHVGVFVICVLSLIDLYRNLSGWLAFRWAVYRLKVLRAFLHIVRQVVDFTPCPQTVPDIASPEANMVHHAPLYFLILRVA